VRGVLPVPACHSELQVRRERVRVLPHGLPLHVPRKVLPRPLPLEYSRTLLRGIFFSFGFGYPFFYCPFFFPIFLLYFDFVFWLMWILSSAYQLALVVKRLIVVVLVVR
jgi:hypothetical protein